MACRQINITWKDNFTDSYSIKVHPLSHSPKMKQFPLEASQRRLEQPTREPQLCMNGSHNTLLVKKDLRQNGVKHGDIRPQIASRKDEMHDVPQQDFQDCAALLDLIKVCAKQKDLRTGSRIHATVLEKNLLITDIALGNALLSMYAKCGALPKAQEMFDELPERNIVTWNALISGYAQHGLGDEALECFAQMQDQGLSPNAITFICILKACGSIGAVEQGEEIHAEICRQGLLERSIGLGNALVDMYVKCGELVKAQAVFDKLPARNVATWTSLITGYAKHGLDNEALSCFGRMQDEGFSPDSVTFICILKACGSVRAAEKGEEIHAEVRRQGLLEKDIVLGNTVVNMYAKSGALAKAQEVFNELPTRNVVTWNALIAGYAQHGLGDEALKCFGRMQDEGLSPNTVTFICVLNACGIIGAAEKGKEIHAEVRKQGLLENNIVLGTALVDMYAKCGMIIKARSLFNKLPARNVATWTALINGYAQQGLAEDALCCFEQMQEQGLSPNAVTFICILNVCGSIGAAEKGQQIHAEAARQGLLEKDITLGTAVVDMYAKCGVLAKAQQVFDELPVRDVATWTALIAGYSQVGKFKRVFDLFIKMMGDSIEPNVITFGILLTACSHAGLLEEGQMYFDTMRTVYCIMPTLEHCNSMVDMFSRAGHFDKAISVIEEVPPSDRLQLWSVLISACQKWVNVDLGRWAFEHAVELNEKCDAAYACMRNIYVMADMQEEADQVQFCE